MSFVFISCDFVDRSACPEKTRTIHELTRTNATLTGVPHRGILYTTRCISETSFSVGFEENLKEMYFRKFVSLFVALVIAASAVTTAFARPDSDKEQRRRKQVFEPVNIAVLIQDDLVSQVANEIGVTRDFVRSLPQGSRVMVGYITAGSLQVRQPFTTDLDKAARSLRIPTASRASSPFNPYVEVIEALKRFDPAWTNNTVLLVSDGLDTSRGFDSTAAGNTLDLHRAISEANRRKVSVFTFYAPSVGLTSFNRLAASYGQSSLNRLADSTGGKAFFQGTSGFVTFDSYFNRLREALNRQYARAS
jgi:hypothetical protein